MHNHDSSVEGPAHICFHRGYDVRDTKVLEISGHPLLAFPANQMESAERGVLTSTSETSYSVLSTSELPSWPLKLCQ